MASTPAESFFHDESSMSILQEKIVIPNSQNPQKQPLVPRLSLDKLNNLNESPHKRLPILSQISSETSLFPTKLPKNATLNILDNCYLKIGTALSKSPEKQTNELA